YYKSLFGEKYLTQGGFLKHSKDYVETNLWTYTQLDRPLVLSGNYLNGIQNGEWNFILRDGTQMSSYWNVYNNRVTPCSFSIPFKYEELYVDSFTLKLRMMNDSLGKVGVMVQIRDTTLKDENLTKFGMRADSELYDQGYKFSSKKREINKDENKYFFYEYLLKDSVNKEAKAYYFFGNTPSKKHFVLFTLFHQGPREDLVQIICNLIATSLYIDDERFYNPYETSETK
ncbi:MAG TPA: hypothetical protein VD794_10560, partial [Flavisolibacter sp.]|nr:hypothetical protein [Flavisolibacter sp.]